MRRAGIPDFAEIAACLARAFEDDPVSEYLFPKSSSRVRRLEGFYRFVLGEISRNGLVYTDERIRGSAIWQDPSPSKPTRMRTALRAISMAATTRSAFFRLVDLSRVMAAAHLREPHWYLAVLGTDPTHQGQGVGSALLAPILRRCDEAASLAYLESSKESNIPFYERHGFRVTGEIQVPGGPKLWPMLREPQA